MRSSMLLALLLVAGACSEVAPSPSDAGPRDASPADASPADAVVGPTDAAAADATFEPDAAPPADAASPDAAPLEDAGVTSPDAAPADTGVVPTRGSCLTAADCGGSACLSVAGGWGTCDTRPPFATTCGGGFDACCTSAECGAQPGGACFGGPLFYCGGAFPQPANLCVYPECASDADCTATTRTDPVGLCVVAGAFAEPSARCSYGDCRLDDDCSARPGGACRPFFNPCSRRLDGFHCTYADSVCRQDSDCRDTRGGYCAPGVGGVTRCEEFVPPP